MTPKAITFLKQLTRSVVNYPVGFFYAQWTHRYLVYLTAFLLFGIWTYAALDIYGWLTWRVTSISFRGNHILHTMINFGLCLYVADEWLARLTGRWGKFSNRTLGKQALIWGLSFAPAFYFQRTVVYEAMQYYALDIYSYYQKYPRMRPHLLDHILFCLPFLVGTIFLLWLMVFVRQRGLRREQLERISKQQALISQNKELHNKVLSEEVNRKIPPLCLQSGNSQLILEQDSISHITVEDHYCRIHTLEEDEAKSYFIKSSLAELLDKLADSRFIQIHRSHVVNVRAIRQLDKNKRASKVYLKTDEVLPVSRHRLTDVMTQIQDLM